jgi:nitroreductase
VELEAGIRSRRSHKRFGREPVPREVVAELLDLARWAPNHHLTEPWRFRVLGPESLARLAATGKPGELEKLVRAPTLVVASAKLTGDDHQNHEDVLATACAVYIVLLAAHARGLASYWRTPRVLQTPEGRAAVGMREDEEFVALIHLGPPVDEPGARPRAPGSTYVTFLD